MTPMKRAALLLGFIQGENVKDWVKHWTIWALDEINTGHPSMDEHFWTTIARAFEQAFQDTGAIECTEEKLCHLSFTPGEVDTFIAKFKFLAKEARYQLDARSTITIFTLKLPFRMMDHLYKLSAPMILQDVLKEHASITRIIRLSRTSRTSMEICPRRHPRKRLLDFQQQNLPKS